MKKEWTEQDLREFVRSAQAAFEDVTLTEADEEAARSWQDDGLMVDYELRNGQVDCVLRRQIVADGKIWKLQMTAPLAGNDLPEDRMSPRERYSKSGKKEKKISKKIHELQKIKV